MTRQSRLAPRVRSRGKSDRCTSRRENRLRPPPASSRATLTGNAAHAKHEFRCPSLLPVVLQTTFTFAHRLHFAGRNFGCLFCLAAVGHFGLFHLFEALLV